MQSPTEELNAKLEIIQKDLKVIRSLFGVSIIIMAILLAVIMPKYIRDSWPAADALPVTVE